jgi:BMFP domain-containing protein YqiC
MRQSQFLDDMGQVLAALLGTAASARGTFRGQAEQRLELLLQRLHLVGRDEFDALHDMLKAARLAQTRIEARLDALEKCANPKSTKPSPKARVNESLTKTKPKTNKSVRKRIKS